jgi:hypothetical protein
MARMPIRLGNHVHQHAVQGDVTPLRRPPPYDARRIEIERVDCLV